MSNRTSLRHNTRRHSLIPQKVIDRWMVTSRLSLAGSVLLALAKIVLGVMSASSFLLVNAGYNLGSAVSKALCLHGYHRGHATERTRTADERLQGERRTYRAAGGVVLSTSLLFTGHGISMTFFGVGANAAYTSIEGITIATLAFVELGLAISGVFTVKAKGEPALSALKLTNLASALIALALTQVALLSFTETDHLSTANGIGSIVFGVAATALGLFMIMHAPQAGTTPLTHKKKEYLMPKHNKKQHEYRLKTPQIIGTGVIGTFGKIEEAVVGTYTKIEDTVVGTYQKIEDKFVDTFLEPVDDKDHHDA